MHDSPVLEAACNDHIHIEALYELDLESVECGKGAREVRSSLILFHSSRY
jgi:hypothetical protein